MAFLHIDQKAASLKIAILKCLLCHIMRSTEVFEIFYPFADCHRDICPHDFLDLRLDLLADIFDPSIKTAAPFCLKQNTDPIVSFLINNSGFFTLHDLITDIKKYKCHQSTFLTLLHIQLIHSGIEIDIKNCHTVSTARKSDSHLLQSVQTFLDVSSTVYKSLDCLRTDNLYIFAIILGCFCQ